MRSRIQLVALEAVGTLAFLIPVRAQAAEASLNPGFLLSAGSGARAVGYGGEISAMYFRKDDPQSLGYGGFLQAQTYGGEYERLAAGFQLGAGYGGELGIAGFTAGANHSATIGMHLGAFVSLAVLGTGVRLTVPFTGQHAGLEPHPWELAWVLTVKIPVYSGRVWGAHGRPLRDERGVVTANVREADDWTGEPCQALVAHLPAWEREELAALWLEAALLEHASVATFAVLGLQLMALGAPPELLLASQQAARDEIEHARLCFGLASAYAGCRLGPDELAVAGAVLDTDPGSLACSSFIDGCIGETYAAALARRATTHATDPTVARALARIADDEARHAALAWNVVDWCSAHHPLRVREALGEALVGLRCEAPAPLRTAQGLPILAHSNHGFVPLHEQAVLLRRAERLARARLERLLRGAAAEAA